VSGDIVLSLTPLPEQLGRFTLTAFHGVSHFICVSIFHKSRRGIYFIATPRFAEGKTGRCWRSERDLNPRKIFKIVTLCNGFSFSIAAFITALPRFVQ